MNYDELCSFLRAGRKAQVKLGWWGWVQISGEGSMCDGNLYAIPKKDPQKQW